MPTIKIEHHLIHNNEYRLAIGDKAAGEIASNHLAKLVAEKLVRCGFVTEETQGTNKVYSIRAIVMTMDEHEQHMTFKRELLERLAALEAIAQEVSILNEWESEPYFKSLKSRAILALKKGE